MIGVNNGNICSKTKNKQSTDYVYHWLNTEIFEVTSAADWTTLERPASKSNIINSQSSRPSKLYDSIKSLFRTNNKNLKTLNKKTVSKERIKNRKHFFGKKRSEGIFTKLKKGIKLLNNGDNNNKKKGLADLDWKLFLPENSEFLIMEDGINGRRCGMTGECHWRRDSLKRNKSDSIIWYKSKYLFFNKVNNIDCKCVDSYSEQLNKESGHQRKHCHNNSNGRQTLRFPFTMKHDDKQENNRCTANKMIKMKTKRKTVAPVKKMNSYRKSKKCDINLAGSTENCRRRETMKTCTIGTQTMNFQEPTHKNCKRKTYNAKKDIVQVGNSVNRELNKNSIPGCTCSSNKMATEKNLTSYKDYRKPTVNIDRMTPNSREIRKQCPTVCKYEELKGKTGKYPEQMNHANVQVSSNFVCAGKLLQEKPRQIGRVDRGRNSQDKGSDGRNCKIDKNNENCAGQISSIGRNNDKTNGQIENFFLYSGLSINSGDTSCQQPSIATPNVEQRNDKFNSIYTYITVNSGNYNNDNNNGINKPSPPIDETLLSFYTLKLDGQVERKLMMNKYGQTPDTGNLGHGGNFRKQIEQSTVKSSNNNYVINSNKQQTNHLQKQPYKNSINNFNAQCRQPDMMMDFNCNNRIKHINKFIIGNETFNNKMNVQKFNNNQTNNSVQRVSCNSRFVSGMQFVNKL